MGAFRTNNAKTGIARKRKGSNTATIDSLPQHLVLALIASRLSADDQVKMGMVAKRFKPVRGVVLDAQRNKAEEVRALASAAAEILMSVSSRARNRHQLLYAAAQEVAPQFDFRARMRGHVVHLVGKQFVAQIEAFGTEKDLDIFPIQGELGYLYASTYMVQGAMKWRVELEQPRIPRILVDAMVDGIGQAAGTNSVKVFML